MSRSATTMSNLSELPFKYQVSLDLQGYHWKSHLLRQLQSLWLGHLGTSWDVLVGPSYKVRYSATSPMSHVQDVPDFLGHPGISREVLAVRPASQPQSPMSKMSQSSWYILGYPVCFYL